MQVDICSQLPHDRQAWAIDKSTPPDESGIHGSVSFLRLGPSEVLADLDRSRESDGQGQIVAVKKYFERERILDPLGVWLDGQYRSRPPSSLLASVTRRLWLFSTSLMREGSHRAHREAALLRLVSRGQTDEPHVVRLLAECSDSLVLEYLPTSLISFLSSQRRKSIVEERDIVQQQRGIISTIITAVQGVCSLNVTSVSKGGGSMMIVHGDIRPEHWRVSSDGKVKLIDFSRAALLTNEDKHVC